MKMRTAAPPCSSTASVLADQVEKVELRRQAGVVLLELVRTCHSSSCSHEYSSNFTFECCYVDAITLTSFSQTKRRFNYKILTHKGHFSFVISVKHTCRQLRDTRHFASTQSREAWQRKQLEQVNALSSAPRSWQLSDFRATWLPHTHSPGMVRCLAYTSTPRRRDMTAQVAAVLIVADAHEHMGP